MRASKRSGLSLLELLAVITILGIIATITIPRISTATNEAKESGATFYRHELNDALERYYFDTNSLPVDLDTLHSTGYYPDPIPLNPVTNEPFELDADTGRVRVN